MRISLRSNTLRFNLKRRRFKGTTDQRKKVLRQWLNTIHSRLIHDRREHKPKG